MLRLFRSKLFVLIFITISILIVMGVSANSNSHLNKINNIFSIPMAPLQRIVSLAGDRIEGSLSFFRDIKAVKEENEQLKLKVDVLLKENMELQEYRKKNTELREALNLKDQFSDYDVLGANIIGKDLGNWFNLFTIDRGSKDGIGYKHPAITSKGLVGMIIQADALSSKVMSIIDEGSTLSGRISKTRDLVRIKGDLTLKDQGLCRMDYIPADVDIAVGDTIETSGMGGIYPKGLLIGRVKEIRKANNELNKYAIIEPAVDFKRLEEVLVLKSKSITQ